MERTPEEEAEVQAMQDELLKSPPSAWSDEPPRVSGYFWWRAAKDASGIPVNVYCTSLGELWFNPFGNRAEKVNHQMGGNWQWQPVAPPMA